jgi:hypothetical protein
MAVDLNQFESCSVSELALVKQLSQRVEAPEAENASLKEQLRVSKLATAPFSKGKPNPAPKKPGRRAGEGRFARRAMSVPGPLDRVENTHVPLELPDCPRYRASLEVVEQTASVEDTLPLPVRSIRRFRVEHGRCHVCGWTGRGRHEVLAGGQHGASTHRTGPNVIAQALTLHCHCGQRLPDGIVRQYDRGWVLLFSENSEIEPTNNRVERGLRGAVIARKVSHCSKNDRGALTCEAMKSVSATLALRGHSVAGALADLIRGVPMQAAVSL